MSNRPPSLFCPSCASCERKARTAVLVPMTSEPGPPVPASTRYPRRGQLGAQWFLEYTCGRCGFREAYLRDDLRRLVATEKAKRRSRVRRERERG